jgi:hypothetical protein
MGHWSCSLRAESARGRVMMALPVDVAGLCPRLGDMEAPPKSRSSLSFMAEAESEPWVGRSGVRRLPSLSLSSSPGSGGAEFAIFRALA